MTEAPPREKVVDLMAALEASVKEAKEARGRHPTSADVRPGGAVTDIAWEDPPPARSGKFDGVRDALKANPGRWALVKSYSTQQNAYSVGWTCFKPHGFEITTRGGDLYVRWPEQ